MGAGWFGQFVAWWRNSLRGRGVPCDVGRCHVVPGGVGWGRIVQGRGGLLFRSAADREVSEGGLGGLELD